MKRKKRKTLMLAFLVLGCCLTMNACAKEAEIEPVARATTPVTPEYPYFESNPSDEAIRKYVAYRKELDTRIEESSYLPSVLAYTEKMNALLLGEKEETILYAPSNTYMALATLAEVGDEPTRAELLHALSVPDIETNRTNMRDMAAIQHYDDRTLKILTANSLWLDDAIPYDERCTRLVAEEYAADIYRGQMGSEEYNRTLQHWLNEKTGGLLSDRAREEAFNADTAFAIASTFYFNGKWEEAFDKAQTHDAVFHGATGDRTVPFMEMSLATSVLRTEDFDAVPLRFDGGATLWIVLPAEGKIDEVASSRAFAHLVEAYEKSAAPYQVQIRMPKLDIASAFSLIPVMEKLGIRQAFDTQHANFAPLTGDLDVFLSRASHATRLTVDEDGAQAAAYTVLATECASMALDDDLDFIVDRPFLMVLTGLDHAPLIVARVNAL